MTEAENISTKINLLIARRALFVREVNFKVAVLGDQLLRLNNAKLAFERKPQKPRATNFGYKDEAMEL